MGLASLALDIGIFCKFLYRIILLNVFLGLDFLGLPYPGRRLDTDGTGEVDFTEFKVYW